MVLFLAASPMCAGDDTKIAYPRTRKADQVDDYFGVKVTDPYRWLEDDNSAETKAWVEAENKVTFAFLEAIPQRARIKERLTQLWNYERFGVPIKRDGQYFYERNSGLQNQRVLYVANSLASEPRVLFDPNALAADGTIALSDYDITDDGKLMAYGLSRAGSDWQEWRVRDVATGKDRDDLVQWVKFSRASWMKDGSGFFYSRFDEPKAETALVAKNEYHKLYYHRLGSKQGEDTLVYERSDHPDWGFEGEVTDDGKYLVVTVSVGTEPKNRVFYKDLSVPDAKMVELLNDSDAKYVFIDNEGPVFFFRTDLDAPRGRVIAIDTTQPERAKWREIIPQGVDALVEVSSVGGQLIAQYLHDAQSLVKGFTFGGELAREVRLPGIGTAGGFQGRRSDAETFYSFTGFTVPATIYRLDAATGQSTVFRAPKVDFNPADFETRQVFYNSKDGTCIPMFITHRRGLEFDGSNPTLLYGYGGFDISLTPEFDVRNLVWMEMGGVYAMPNLRGGGEYGIAWHQAGILANKQNAFDDFIAAAEWLIAAKYTSTPKLAISGGSNGGLLVGACMTQRPELFGAALPAVGVLDMLRFHQFTIGWAWKSDYGSSEDEAGFKTLYAYSPLHRLTRGTRYPATLVTTADHDDRVVPAHSFKFVARLQECQASDGPPVLIRIETKAGHGGGKPISKIIDEATDKWGFLVRELGMK
ncbi:MAG TPA: prolyl oligopeptidase family serine peptidase [Chthoniobacterales bacterium]